MRKSMQRFRLVLFMVSLAAAVLSQPFDRVNLESLSREQFPSAVQQLNAFLEIPNDSHYPEQAEKNAAWCIATFRERGFETTVLETSGGPPLIFARRITDPGKNTILFYLQIDGQPVDPDEWDQEDPFKPVLKARNASGEWEIIDWNLLGQDFNPEWRIFARSSSDSKGNGISLIAALDIMDRLEYSPDFNIKVIMDLEEERGSPHLPAAVAKYKDLLAADMMLIMDGTRHISNLPTLTFGARGIAKITLTIFGPRTPLHSGQYGNYAPNPAFGLARLLAGLKDEQGRVTLPGFYRGVELTDEEKRILNEIPEDEPALLERIGVAKPEQVGATYQEAMQYPTLNIRGLSAAWTGDKVRTIIPDKAIAEIDLRLVRESEPEELIGLVKKYVEDQGYHLVDSIPTDEERRRFEKLASFDYSISYKAFRTSFDSEPGRFLTRALTRAFDRPPVLMRTTGGSQPIASFTDILEIPAVAVRIPNPDNNIHAPNENLRLGNFLEGIQTCLAILTEKY